MTANKRRSTRPMSSQAGLASFISAGLGAPVIRRRPRTPRNVQRPEGPMNVLTEQVAREHRPYRDPVAPGRLWLCECDGGNASRDIVAHVRHVAAATERAVRASVAAEIRAERTRVLTGDVAGQLEVAALGLAARIAEGTR